MTLYFNQRDPTRHRFPLPNGIWKWKLKPQAFAILAYLCYLHGQCQNFVVPGADAIASQLHMSADMAVEQITELKRCGLLDAHMVPMIQTANKHFFSLPNELFFLDIGHGAITVYAYLLYCEDRRSHMCHPSYRTIADAVRLAVSTVIKQIKKLVDRQFIVVEHSSYIDNKGMKWNSNNRYTILPIQTAMDCCYQRQLLRLEEQALLRRQAENSPCTPL